jgi:tetraacyldisaccharide 4'-kinase
MSLDYRSIMNGRRRDLLAVVMRGALRVASIPYGIAVSQRNRRFDSGSKQIQHCGVPVISIGNLTTGGTGKTPIVCFIAKWLHGRGIRVAIVSRGYGRGDADANDEALELHSRLPDVPHVQHADRVQASRDAIDRFEAEVILMDDGFQHRRLHRDLNIVVIDATCPFGFERLLPRGLLREPVENLCRADMVMITRCDAVEDPALLDIEQTVLRHNESIPIVRSRHEPTILLEYPSTRAPIAELSGKNVAVISAIGNPAAFETTVRSCGATVIDSRQLGDHDSYSPETVDSLVQWVESLDDRVELIVCTHKDLVKLQTNRLGGRSLVAILIELTVTSNLDSLEASLEAIVERTVAR